MHYVKEGASIACKLCPHNCNIKEGMRGICGVREFKNGEFQTLNYSEVSSIGIDPIEKKPLYHYKPGSQILSVGSFGCNFSCGFCQNYGISKNMPETREMSPDELVSLAANAKVDGNIGIAFTYNEPSIWYEYVFDTSKICRAKGMDVVLVTNGYINNEPLGYIIPYINAMNIDLKAFNNEYYKKVCGGDIESVLSTIKLANSGCHVEITTLIVGGYNDKDEEIEELSKWVASINPDIPLHLTRYHPSYKFTAPPTSKEKMLKCTKVAKKYLNYVYTGNMFDIDNNTYCYNCGETLIEREYYKVNVILQSDKCPHCGTNINVIL